MKALYNSLFVWLLVFLYTIDYQAVYAQVLYQPDILGNAIVCSGNYETYSVRVIECIDVTTNLTDRIAKNIISVNNKGYEVNNRPIIGEQLYNWTISGGIIISGQGSSEIVVEFEGSESEPGSLSVTISYSESRSFCTYDAMKEITINECPSPIYEYTYVYDAAGNRTMVTLLKSSLATGQGNKPVIETTEGQEFRLYPNPTKGLITIECPGLTNEIKISCTILDASGKIIYDTGYAGQQTIICDLSAEPKGLYIIQLKFQEKQHVLKVLKE